MTYVDRAVLTLIEQACRRFQVLTGRTNVWLAFQLTNLSVIVYFAWLANLYLLTGHLAFRLFVATFSGGVAWILSRTVFKTSVEFAESQAYTRVAKGVMNPRKLRDAQLRIAFLTLSVVLAYPLWLAYRTLGQPFVLLMDVLIVLTTVVSYLLACDPLPPTRSRVSAWLDTFAGARRATAPNPSLGTADPSRTSDAARTRLAA